MANGKGQGGKGNAYSGTSAKLVRAPASAPKQKTKPIIHKGNGKDLRK